MQLWNWVKSLFSKQDLTKNQEVYTLEERLIYSYFDGKKTVKEDPIVIYKRLADKRADIKTNFSVADSPSKNSQKAYDSLIKDLCSVFDVTLWDKEKQEGLTHTEVIDLFDDFHTWLDEVKKNLAIFATPPTHLAGFDFTSPTDRPTTNTSDSGFSGPELSTDKPTSLPLGSPMPMEALNQGSTSTEQTQTESKKPD